MLTTKRKTSADARIASTCRWIPLLKLIANPLATTPQKYVSAQDLSKLIGLAQSFIIAPGTLEKRLLAIGQKLTAFLPADAWLIGVDFGLTKPSSGRSRRPLVVTGGSDRATIDSLTIDYAKTLRKSAARNNALHGLATARSGQVLTLLDQHNTVQSPTILSIRGDAENQLITWLSVHRVAGGTTAFSERDRRVIELFHSQTAWGIGVS